MQMDHADCQTTEIVCFLSVPGERTWARPMRLPLSEIGKDDVCVTTNQTIGSRLPMTRVTTTPKLAITMGDPAGIGPEVCLMLLQQASEVIPAARPIVYGDRGVLQRVARFAGLAMPPEDCIRHINAFPDASAITCGKIDATCGQAAYDFLKSAIDASLAGEVDAIVTAPLNKEALHAAGIRFPRPNRKC